MRNRLNRTISVLLLVTTVFCSFICFSSCKKEQEAAPVPDVSGFTGNRIYFAAPLFSEAEREYNLYLTNILESYGYEVFLPQRDGYLASELEGLTEEEMTAMIFERDRDEVLNADIIFIVLDGRAPDEGACVELGIAYASGKRCYGFKTDARSVEYGMDINPMITGCLTHLFYNLDGEALVADLEAYLEQYPL